jgi:putative transposase
LYNILLTHCKENYEKTGKCLTWFDLNRIIPIIKANEPRFKEISSQVLINQSNRLTKAFDNFFRRCKEKEKGAKIKAGYPRYKKVVHSMTFSQNHSSFKIVNKKLQLSKVGRMPIVIHRPLPSRIKTLTISHSAGGEWYAIFSCEMEEKIVDNMGPKVGLDRGLISFIYGSDGSSVEPPKYL